MNHFDLHDTFVKRHIGPRNEEIETMLNACGVSSTEELIEKTVPAHIRLNRPLNLPEPLNEFDFLQHIRKYASSNVLAKSYIGMGYHPTATPNVIQRNILENPGWYTQYTPYQAEISQGRLEALMNFQTMIIDLTGMEMANASLLDEGTAAAEAMLMLQASGKRKRGNKFFVDHDIFPQTLDILRTRALPKEIEIVFDDVNNFEPDESYFGLFLQYPSGSGDVKDYRGIISAAAEKGVPTVVASDLMSLALLTPPGEFGADVVVGSSQRFGVPMGYGGPHAAFFATKEQYKRLLPGRIIGASVDVHGNNAYRMALQTREQHIKREKATSNICTAQVLLAVIAGMYAVYHGPEGIKAIAKRIYSFTALLDKLLKKAGLTQINTHYFDTLVIEVKDNDAKEKVRKAALEENVNFRYYKEPLIGISLHELTVPKNIRQIVNIFSVLTGKEITLEDVKAEMKDDMGTVHPELKRTSDFLTHPVFNAYHSETELMRYAKRLENRDLSLTYSMIPLGSCTMKLNAAAEMRGITIPGFSFLHPFVPVEQAGGYKLLIDEISSALAEITGLPGVSLQPNSGAQGEYTGLMVIREYHRDRGDDHRNIVIIPSSAHGTNPASGVMAGMEVVVVKCDDHGNIDMDDLTAKAEKHSENLSALMVTYPSTHGVFEESIVDICDIIHKHGGQVYLDGANMNAQVGLTSPALIGADVVHLNLHKTFAIPHGGGGPGMGPICCAEHLVPFLPGHPEVQTGGEKAIGAVNAAPYGSASILVISLGYIRMLGAEGLKRASEMAILNANYIKAKLEEHYPVLYKGKHGFVAHEMILDVRGFKHEVDIDVEDMAKRLMDYGFHAPTVSFPVPGTFMIEPTESESLQELDRFIEAMISIREEIQEVADGTADREDNLLKNAPHTMQAISADEWTHPYGRERAGFPTAFTRAGKFWPSVGRVNSAYGDRNLVCSCNPISDYIPEEEAAEV